MKSKNRYPLCFVAGRSGGHLIPALTIARKIKKETPKIHITFFTTNKPLDKKIIHEYKQAVDRFIPLALENFPYKKMYRYPAFFWNFFVSFFKSIYLLIRTRPKKVISMGGYISLPICLSAFLLRIPIEMYELNATPGRAIKLLAPLSSNIYVCFKQAIGFFPLKKCTITDYPIRFTPHFRQKSMELLIRKYNLSSYRFTILVLGGSQGSVLINNMIRKWLETNNQIHENVQIIHQTGSNDSTNWTLFYKNIKIPAIIFDFQTEIKSFYQLADIAVCRSGAGTLFETIFFKKKCITIPLETTTTSHQLDNAGAMHKQFPDLVTALRENEIQNDINLFCNQINQHIAAHMATKTSTCRPFKSTVKNIY